MNKLRSYAPMSRRSEKVKEGEAEFQAVYAVVDARSGGRCEVDLLLFAGEDLSFYSGTPKATFRCRRRATDHHHLYKPRRSNHEAALIVALCRHHHERCEWPYKRGRLVISLVDGRRVFAIQFAKDKFALRSGATAP